MNTILSLSILYSSSFHNVHNFHKVNTCSYRW